MPPPGIMVGVTTRRLLSTSAAADLLGVAPATIRDWHRRGLVRPVRRNAWDLLELRAAEQAPKPYHGRG